MCVVLFLTNRIHWRWIRFRASPQKFHNDSAQVVRSIHLNADHLPSGSVRQTETNINHNHRRVSLHELEIHINIEYIKNEYYFSAISSSTPSFNCNRLSFSCRRRRRGRFGVRHQRDQLSIWKLTPFLDSSFHRRHFRMNSGEYGKHDCSKADIFRLQKLIE